MAVRCFIYTKRSLNDKIIIVIRNKKNSTCANILSVIKTKKEKIYIKIINNDTRNIIYLFKLILSFIRDTFKLLLVIVKVRDLWRLRIFFFF